MTGQTKVYFIQDDNGMIKIGYSSDPISRILALQTAHSGRLSFLRVIDGGQKTEAWLHRRYASLRVGGEWFHYIKDMEYVVPPDEIPIRQTIKPELRLTLREQLIQFDAMQLFTREQKRLFAAALLSSFWDHDIDALLAWIRNRTGVPDPYDVE